MLFLLNSHSPRANPSVSTQASRQVAGPLVRPQVPDGKVVLRASLHAAFPFGIPDSNQIIHIS